MCETRLSDLEKRIDGLLNELGRRGLLDMALNDSDLERVVSPVTGVALSAGFRRRAEAAIGSAQREREKRDPAVALGAAVSRARSQAGLEVAEVADETGIAVRLLDALETGRLSARQIVCALPPAVAIHLLVAIGFAVDEFTYALMDLAATGGTTRIVLTARSTDREKERKTPDLTLEVVEYVAALQRIAQSGEPPAQ